jgi:hypothetical protein
MASTVIGMMCHVAKANNTTRATNVQFERASENVREAYANFAEMIILAPGIAYVIQYSFMPALDELRFAGRCVLDRLSTALWGNVGGSSINTTTAIVPYDPEFARAQLASWSGYPSEQGTFYGLSNGIVLTQAQWDSIGTSPHVGDFTGFEGLSQKQILARIPVDYDIVEQSEGYGIKFVSPNGLTEIRIHGPIKYENMDPLSPSAQGWVARVAVKDPSHLFATGGNYPGWVSYNDLGISVPNRTDAAHIPVFGNPANYNPEPTLQEWLDFFKEYLGLATGK